MKITISLLAAGAVMAAFAIPAGAAPSAAGATTPVVQDFSAAKKKHRYYRTYREGYYAEPGPYGYYGGSDPTARSNSYLNTQRAVGRCVIDLGYGRFSYCN